MINDNNCFNSFKKKKNNAKKQEADKGRRGGRIDRFNLQYKMLGGLATYKKSNVTA